MSILAASSALISAAAAQLDVRDAQRDPLLLVHRMTMGLDQEQRQLLGSLGWTGYIEYHLSWEEIDDSTLDQRLQNEFPTLFLAPHELDDLGNAPAQQLTYAAILRAAVSRRQLLERMVEFWTDHFNIDIRTEPASFLKTVDDRDVIRPHALGFFPDMLRASAHSPAMLAYLDNNTNVAGRPNENYARELMELHTLGVDGGYTQQDVEDVARCFTGWTYYNRNSGDLAYRFRFVPEQHDQGPKRVLGVDIPPGGGIADGERILDILAAHPSTARFISRKLARWFLGYEPGALLVDAVARAYTASGGDIRVMIRTMLSPAWAQFATPKLKRPFHHMVSGLRALRAGVTNPASLRAPLIAAGHLPFTWSPPDGFPDTVEYWYGLVLPRWSFGASIMNGEYQGIGVDLAYVLGGAVTAAQIADRIDLLLFDGRMPPSEKALVRQYMLPDNPPQARIREAIGLAIGSPAFQWY